MLDYLLGTILLGIYTDVDTAEEFLKLLHLKVRQEITLYSS